MKHVSKAALRAIRGRPWSRVGADLLEERCREAGIVIRTVNELKGKEKDDEQEVVQEHAANGGSDAALADDADGPGGDRSESSAAEVGGTEPTQSGAEQVPTAPGEA